MNTDKQMLVATYNVFSYFEVPDDIDLEDKTQVFSYNVKWDILYIELTNGKVIKVKSKKNEFEPDLKYADKTSVEIYDDTLFEE